MPQMSNTTLAVVGLAVIVIVLMLLFARGARRGRRADLVQLSNDSRDRYLVEWDRIETRFLDAPEEAVREADALVMSLLRERRHPLEERHLPREMQDAHLDATVRGDRTEGMRRAMLHYRTVMEKMVGAPVRAERDGRREMA
jgi:hypothetical protein